MNVQSLPEDLLASPPSLLLQILLVRNPFPWMNRNTCCCLVAELTWTWNGKKGRGHTYSTTSSFGLFEKNNPELPTNNWYQSEVLTSALWKYGGMEEFVFDNWESRRSHILGKVCVGLEQVHLVLISPEPPAWPYFCLKRICITQQIGGIKKK